MQPHSKVTTVARFGAVRFDRGADGRTSVFYAGRPYPAGTIGSCITARPGQRG